MPRAKRLTPASVERIKPAANAQCDHFDSFVPGFALRVSPNGAKSWTFLYRIDGKQKRLTLGRYPALGLVEARSAASGAYESVQKGRDPKRELEQRREGAVRVRRDTFGFIAAEFIEKHSKRYNKTWKKTEYNLKRYVLPHWADRSVSSISRRDGIDLIERIAARNGLHTATYVRANLRKLFAWACQRDLVESNPCTDIARPVSARATERDRVLRFDEIRAVWLTSDQLGYPFEAFTKLLFLTAQRRTEVSTVRWSQLDTRNRVWRLPREDTKSCRSHDLPLSTGALAVLNEIPRFEEGDYVLTTTFGSSSIGGFSKAKRRLDDYSGVTGWRFHDIRRTVGTCMTEHLGVSEFVVGRVLNHAHASVTSIYARASYMKEKRAALDRWSEFLAEIVAGKTIRQVS